MVVLFVFSILTSLCSAILENLSIFGRGTVRSERVNNKQN